MDFVQQYLSEFLHGAMYIALGVFFIFLAKLIHDKITSYDEDELIGKNNVAIGLQRGGLYLGVAIGMYGVMTGPSLGFVQDALHLAIDGVIIVLLMIVAFLVNDHLILHKVNNRKATQNGNIAVGWVEAASYVASGMILGGSFSGDGGGYVAALVFFTLGQIALVICFWVFEYITAFDAGQEITDANNSAGIATASIVVGLGFILSRCVAGDFVSWEHDITLFALTALTGIVMLIAFHVLVRKLVLPKIKYDLAISEGKNVAAVTIASTATVAVSILISALF